MCSVDERRLFPDLDGVAAEIARRAGLGGVSETRTAAQRTWVVRVL